MGSDAHPGATPAMLGLMMTIRRHAPHWGRIAVLASLLVSSASSLAQDFGTGLLWRVDPPNGAAASHLYGTVHLDDVRAVRFSPVVRQTLAQSRRFALELVTDESSAQVFQTAATLPSNQNLATLLPAADYQRVEDLLRNRYGVPAYVTEHMAPWAAYVTLNLPGPKMGYSVDELLHHLAVKQGKPVTALESVEAQVGAMQAIPLSQQTALLSAAARDHARVLESVQQLLERYLAEDLKGIFELQDDAAAAAPEIADAQTALLESVLYGRNPGMAEQTARLANEGAAFVALGALHLYGPRGVLAELEKRGYRISRVPLKTNPGS